MPEEIAEPHSTRPEGDPPVDDLLVELLLRTEENPSAREEIVDELCEKWPSRERLLRVAVRNLSSAGLIDVEDLPKRIGEFIPIRRLGGGGMGVVLLAEQPSLDRRVAIKLLRTDEFLRPGARERFQRETEAVARLAHPNVVSVHSIGHDGGIPFLVMDHVEGTSLDRIIAAQAGRRPEDLTRQDFLNALRAEMAGHGEVPDDVDAAMFAGSWVDVCLRVARDVAGALAHSHSRDVLHRDVKPSNIMITPGGRTYLVDFGLAALLDSDRLTRTGTQIGSLPYIPPEHLRGQAEPSALGDIYSLGVTLHELLLLDLPFPGRGSPRLRADIEDGRMLRARAANPAVSADLETVLCCACDHDAERRFASASALAADLTNVLDGNPVSARPASRVRRLARWVRRRPEAAALAALGTLVAIGAPAAYGVIQRGHVNETLRLNRQLGEALADEIDARSRADANYTRAVDTIVRVTGVMAREGLEHEPRMQRAQLEIAGDAIRIFGELRDERPGDDRVDFNWADLHLVRGGILVEVGRVEEGIEEFEFHAAILEDLLRRFPKSISYRFNLADGRVRLGNAHRDLGHTELSLARYESAAADLRVVHASDPGSLRFTRGVAQCLVSFALALNADAQLDRAEAVLAEALPLAESAMQLGGDLPDPTHVYAQALRARARLALSRGDDEGVARASAEAIASALRALARAPGHRHYQNFVVEASVDQLRALARLGRFDETTDVAERAERMITILEQRYPSIYVYHARRVELISTRSYIAAESGDMVGAIQLSERAIEAHQGHEPDEENAEAATRLLGGLHAEIAGRIAVCTELGPERFQRAEVHARSSIKLLRDDPDPANLRMARYNLVLALAGQDRVDRAFEESEELSNISRDLPRDQRFLADAWCEVLGACLRTEVDGTLPRELALESLERAVEAGYRDRRELSRTVALDALREDQRFRTLMNSLEPER